jgi:arginine:agmatine antiporter
MTESVRQIGLVSATMLVSGNIIGTGIFMMPTVMAKIGGIATLGWLIAVPGSFVVAYVFARLSRVRPKAGGPYAYAHETLGDFAGFQCNLLYWFANVVGNIAVAISITGYLAFFVPGLRNPYLAALGTMGVIWLAAVINIVGPRLVTRFETLTTLLGIGPIAVVGLVGWIYFDPKIFAAGWNPSELSYGSAISSAFSIMFWAFMGIESASIAAEIVKDPERNVARATILGVLISALVYVLATTAILGLIPNEMLRHSTAPFADAATRVVGSTGAALITVCAILKALGSLGGWTLITAETAMATARDGLFPMAFAKTDGRGVPVLGLIVVSTIMTMVLLVTLSPELGEAFAALTDISVLLILTPYILAAVSVFFYAKLGVVPRYVIAAAVVGIGYCLAIIIGSAGTTVAIAMILGLSAAPLFGAFLSTSPRPGLNPSQSSD